MIERALFADIGSVHIWSGAMPETWESKTYQPGILLGEEIPAGSSLTPGSSPGLDVYLSHVPNLRSDVKSGDDVDLHVVQRDGITWRKIGGYWAIVDEVLGSIENLRISTLPPFERFTKVTRPRWSNHDQLSRYPGDYIFKNLENLRVQGQTIEFP